MYTRNRNTRKTNAIYRSQFLIKVLFKNISYNFSRNVLSTRTSFCKSIICDTFIYDIPYIILPKLNSNSRTNLIRTRKIINKTFHWEEKVEKVE